MREDKEATWGRPWEAPNPDERSKGKFERVYLFFFLKGEKYIFDADHIYPFSKILDDYNITSIEEAISCEKLWDIENGRTLCRDCHKQTDTYGVNFIKNA